MPNYEVRNAGDTLISARVTGETQDRLRILADGTVLQGNGTATPQTSDSSSRASLFARAQGYVAETPINQGAVSGATVAVGGTIYVTGVVLYANESVSNVSVLMTVNGSGLTLVKAGIYDKTGARLATSADDKASYNSGAVKLVTTALTGAWVVPTTDLYYAAFVATGTTPPTLASANSSAAPQKLGSGPFAAGRQTGQTDLITSATIAAGGPVYWFGLS